MPRLVFWALPALLGLAACSTPADSPAGVAAMPFTTVPSNSGAWTVAVRTGPEQPPTRGVANAELTITDTATGAPVDGLSITVVPWMPAMGHGASIAPTVTAIGKGAYDVTNIDLYMPGRWELRTTISSDAGDAGTVNDGVTIGFDIP